MKLAIPMAGLAFLAMAGCATQHRATESSALDVNPPMITSTPAYVPAPVVPVQTFAPAPSPAPMMAVASSGGSYTIKPGDTLWKIATVHYGDGKKWKQIVDANPGLNPNKLIVGKTIALP